MAEEENFILRLEDPALAQQLRDALRSGDALATPELGLRFEGPWPSRRTPGKGSEASGLSQPATDPQAPRQGLLKLGSSEHPVYVKALPTVVECFKTLDDTNLVKVSDVGEVLVVPKEAEALPEGEEWPHGVTPPMRFARARHFRKTIPADPEHVSRVELDLLAIATGRAPLGTEYLDVEEEFVVDEHGEGSWQPLAQDEKKAADLAQKKKKKAKKGEKEKEAEDEALLDLGTTRRTAPSNEREEI